MRHIRHAELSAAIDGAHCVTEFFQGVVDQQFFIEGMVIEHPLGDRVLVRSLVTTDGDKTPDFADITWDDNDQGIMVQEYDSVAEAHQGIIEAMQTWHQA